LNPRTEIFNNYCAKPDSELLLSVTDFALTANPDDASVLKIGRMRDTTNAAAAARACYEVGC
jgi:hypothetical protein